MPALTCRIIPIKLFVDKTAVHSCTGGAADYWRSVKPIASRSLLQMVLVWVFLGHRMCLRALQDVWVQGEEHNPSRMPCRILRGSAGITAPARAGVGVRSEVLPNAV